MQQALDFELAIKHGIQGLTEEELKLVAEFVFFLRKKREATASIKPETWEKLIHTELMSLYEVELSHLEQEFEGYADQYPKQ